MSSPSFDLFDDLEWEMHKLEDGQRLQEITTKVEAVAGWSVANDLTIYSGRIFVPIASALWSAILATAHGARHEGTKKTLPHLCASFYNANTAKLVKDYVKSCVICQRNKSKHLHPIGLLTPSSCRALCGPTSPWTLWRVSHVSAGNRWSLRWWIASLSMSTSSHWATRTPLSPSPRSSSTTSSNWMVSRAPSSAIMTLSSPTHFGLRCFASLVYNCV
jgi:hypothetical protein